MRVILLGMMAVISGCKFHRLGMMVKTKFACAASEGVTYVDDRCL